MSDDELKVFSKTVGAIFRDHPRPGSYTNKDAVAIYKVAERGYTAFAEHGQLLNYLPKVTERSTSFKFAGRYMYLKPITNGSCILPVLSIHANYSRSLPEVRLRLGLFQLAKDGIVGVGVRLESPEGYGPHNYFHMQLISGFQKGDLMPGCPPWLPTREPAIPLEVDNAVSMLVCLFIGLYGFTYLRTLETLVGKDILPFTKDLASRKVEPAYLKVVAQGLDFIYATWDDGAFQKLARLRHGQCTITPTTATAFDLHPKSRRAVV